MVTLGELLEQKRRDDIAANSRLSKGLQIGSTAATNQANAIVKEQFESEDRNRFNPLNTLASAGIGFLTGGPVGAVIGAVGAKKGDTDLVGSAVQGAAQGTAGKFLGAAPLEALPAGGMAATGAAATPASSDLLGNIVRNLAATGNETEKAGLLKTMGAPEALTKPLEAIGDKATTGKLQTINSMLQNIKADFISGTSDVKSSVEGTKKVSSLVDSLGLSTVQKKTANDAINETLKLLSTESKTKNSATLKYLYDANGDMHTVKVNKGGNIVSVDGDDVDGFKMPKGWSTTKPKNDNDGGVTKSQERQYKVQASTEFNNQAKSDGLSYGQKKAIQSNTEARKQFESDYVNYLKGSIDEKPVIIDYIPVEEKTVDESKYAKALQPEATEAKNFAKDSGVTEGGTFTYKGKSWILSNGKAVKQSAVKSATKTFTTSSGINVKVRQQ
jgi:hypothetical protein